MINTKLAKDRALTEDVIKQIKKLHIKRETLHAKIRKLVHTSSLGLPVLFKDSIRMKYKKAYGIERKLQKLWGFKQDDKFIKFWNIPGCSCPTMDNDDRYPFGHYVYSCECIIHSCKVDGV
jgi:hypothetical protein